MSEQSRKQKPGTRVWNRLSAAGLCVAFLCGGLCARAETRLGAPAEEADSLPISPAGAKHAPGTGWTAESSATKTSTAVAVVVVGIGVALTLARKFIPGLAPDSPHRMIQVLGHAPLGTKGTVYVLRCGPRVLIVGGTANQMTTLAEIADPDEIDEFVHLSGPKPPGSRRPDAPNAATPGQELKGQVDGMLDRIDSWKTSG